LHTNRSLISQNNSLTKINVFPNNGQVNNYIALLSCKETKFLSTSF